MTNYVPAEGSLDAKLVVIGEAPASREVELGRPFVGSSGQTWERWLSVAGLRRGDARIMNVYEHQAPANKIERVARTLVEDCMEEVPARLTELRDPVVVVPMGNYALRAVTRGQYGKVYWDGRPPGIAAIPADITMTPRSSSSASLHPSFLAIRLRQMASAMGLRHVFPVHTSTIM